MLDLSRHVLGETDTPVPLETSDDCRAAATELVRQGHRTLLIFTHDLDRKVYDDVDFIDAVSALARRHHLSWIRILVQDMEPVIHGRHRLVELARRLSSRIEIRHVHPNHRSFNKAYLVVDDTGLLLRDTARGYSGSANFYAPHEAREYAALFHRVWDMSQRDPNLNRLHL